MILIFYNEICDDVINHINEGFIVHDITADLEVQTISLFSQLNEIVQLKKKLLHRYPNGVYMNPDMDSEQYIFIPTCILQDNIYNLVVKDKIWDDFDLSYIDITIKIMKLSLLHQLQDNPDLRIKLFMPIICTDISWQKIKQLLINNFLDMDIEVIVCYKEEQKKILER